MMLDVIRYCPFQGKKYVVKHNPADTSIIDKLVKKKVSQKIHIFLQLED